MLKDGSYVRLVLFPETRMGTLHQFGQIGETPQFVFRLDPRFKEKLADFFVEEDDVQECERPSDDDINETNRILDLEPKG
jgi:hypothetical protein